MDFSSFFSLIISKFAPETNIFSFMAKRINRLKVILAEKNKTGRWLAEQMGRDKATVSKWCTNTSQPDVSTFVQIAELLGVDFKDLFNSSDQQ